MVRLFCFYSVCKIFNNLLLTGRVSNIEHSKTPIGSAQRNRELGNRPRSGLWQRKDGRHGRKIRKLPPMKLIPSPPEAKPKVLHLTLRL